MDFPRLQDLLTNNPHADLRINLKDDFVIVSKSVLHDHNTWFRDLLLAHPTRDEISCPLTLLEMNLYLRYLLSKDEFDLNAENIYQMINVYQVFRLPDIERTVIHFIQNNQFMPAEMFVYCRDNHLPTLLKVVKDRIYTSFEAYMISGHFNNIGYNTFILIFDRNFTLSKCQDTMFEFFVNWLDSDFGARKYYYLQLIERIDFRFISFEFAQQIAVRYKRIFEIDGVAVFLFQKMHIKGKYMDLNNQTADEVFIVSYTKEIFAYNSESQRTRKFGTIDTNVEFFGCEKVDNDLFIFGKRNDNDFEKFGINKFNLISRKNSIYQTTTHPACHYESSVNINNKIMSIGYDSSDTAWMSIFDISSMRWESDSKLPLEVFSHSSVTLNNAVYVISGSFCQTFRYDLREGLWHILPTSNLDLSLSAVSQYNDLNIIKVGGHLYMTNDDLEIEFDDSDSGCEIFDTRSSTWRVTNDLPVSLEAAKCCQIKNTVVLFGGKSDEATSQGIYTFDIPTEVWTRNETELCNIDGIHSVHSI
uniref:BTB domain-containing protein n=2 Tax=Rhabditophanes sp. KR3021 TaxID=114890 RepID=A0AC35TZJ6_9BILA